MLDTCRHLRPGCLPSPATSPSQLVLEACRQGAELDVVLAPVEREVVVDAGDHEYEDYDEETDTWVRKFHWGDIRVGCVQGCCTCLAGQPSALAWELSWLAGVLFIGLSVMSFVGQKTHSA